MDVRRGFSPSCCSTTPFQLAFASFDAYTVHFLASMIYTVRSSFSCHSAIYAAPKSGLCVFFLGKCSVLWLKFYIQCFQRTALLLMTSNLQIINLNYLYQLYVNSLTCK